MQRIDGKKNLASLILVEQGNKKAFGDIVKLYENDIYFLCGGILGFSKELKDTVCDIFVNFYSSADNTDRNSFETCLYTYAVRYCSDTVRKNKDRYSFGTKYPVNADDCGITADELLNILRAKKEPVNPDRRSVSFFAEMLNKMPVQSKIVFSYLHYTNLSYGEIAKLEGADEKQITSSALFGYSYLAFQSKRAVILHLNFANELEYIPFYADYLASITKAPFGLNGEIRSKIGLDDDLQVDLPEEDTEDGYPEIKQDGSGKIRILRITAVISTVIILIGLGLFVKFSQDDKNAHGTDAVTQITEENAVWDGRTATSFKSGDGSKNNPYIIADASQLAYFSNLINSGNTEYFASYYRLENDIEINRTDNFDSWGTEPPDNNFTPAGYIKDSEEYRYFCGTFDGNGHKITGLYCNTDVCSGLFGYINNGTVKNLTLEKAFTVSDKYTGGIVAFCRSSSADSGITNCTVSGKIYGNNYVGGIAGYCDIKGDRCNFTVSDCKNSAEIVCKKSSAGGIAGFIQSDGGITSVTGCINTGSVSASDNSGGIAGVQQLIKGSSRIADCINTGTVRCENKTVGAIAGVCDCTDVSSFAVIENCFYLESSAEKTASEGDNTKISAVVLDKTEIEEKIKLLSGEKNA